MARASRRSTRESNARYTWFMCYLTETNIILLPGSRDNGATKMVPEPSSNMDRRYDGPLGLNLDTISVSSSTDDLLEMGAGRIRRRLRFDGSAR